MSIGVEEKKKFYIKLFYDFGGSPKWIKEELIKKRYDSFRYFIPVKTKESANSTIEIYSKGNLNFITITSSTRIANFVAFPKIICKDFEITSRDLKDLYLYLKETYFEKEKGI